MAIRATLAESVIQTHRANPEWTYRQVSEACGTSPAYVRKVAQRHGLHFRAKMITNLAAPAKEKKPRRRSKSKPKKFVPLYYGRASAGYTSFSYVQLM